jgi:uncharacterized protein YigE (DUF2233 family)
VLERLISHVCLLALLYLAPAIAGALECSQVVFREIHATACKVDLRDDHLQLFMNDAAGIPYKSLRRVADSFQGQPDQLAFAMNAGMFREDYSPLGLLVMDGRQIHRINLASGGFGNFYMKPNGVFLLTSAGAQIVESTKYAAVADPVILATQSGPLMVSGGTIHSGLNPQGTSRYVRNGVGIVNSNEIVFAISDEAVTFYEFALLFRDFLKCSDALYLDGSVSSMYSRTLARDDERASLGPIIGVTYTTAPKTTKVDVPQHEPVVLKFDGFDPTQAPVDEQWLLSSLSEALQAASRWSARSDRGAPPMALRARVEPNQSQIVLQYAHLARNLNAEWGQTLTFPVGYEVQRGKKNLTVRLNIPTQGNLVARPNPDATKPLPRLEPTAAVLDDLSKIMAAAPAVTLQHEVKISGEEHSKLTPQVAMSNVGHSLAPYAFGKLTQPNIFAYRAGAMTVPLRITAERDRSGTKVLYEATLPYSLTADGKTSGYDLPAALGADIRRMLNDRRR